jgi:Domain of unknown function (DUF4276)
VRYLASVVEGHGEVEALPVLIRRIADSVGFVGDLRVNPPIRVKSGSFLNDEDYFRKYVALAAGKAAMHGGSLLILLDCEDDCPGTLGPALLQKAQAVRVDVDIFVALAYREYETWFIGAAASLRGRRGLPQDLSTPHDAEQIRNAKGWLSDRMNVRYDPVIHQLEFTKAFDLKLARTNRSFDRVYGRMQIFLGDDSD